MHSSAWRCTCIPPGHVFHGRGLVERNVTCTPTPSLAGSMTLPQAAEAARGGRAQQHMVGRRVFELETPSTIDPNHPTLRGTPSLRPMPPLTLAAHVPCGQRYEAADGQKRTTSSAQGRVQSSWGRGSGRGPWWWWPWSLFPRSTSSSVSSA